MRARVCPVVLLSHLGEESADLHFVYQHSAVTPDWIDVVAWQLEYLVGRL